MIKHKWTVTVEFEGSDALCFALEQVIGGFFRTMALGYASRHKRGAEVKE